MALTPKFQAVVKVWDTVLERINIEFARPADRDVLADLSALGNYQGVKVLPLTSYVTIDVPSDGCYDIYDVAGEVEDILRRHQFEKLKFIINNSESCGKELSTMTEIK